MSQYRNTSTIKHIIIHCAATPNGKHFNAMDIDRWHGERGFKRNAVMVDFRHPMLIHIGYHFVICLDGTVETGRKLSETGAHARGYNKTSIGICLIGTDEFTAAQWQSLKTQVQQLKQKFTTVQVLAHHQINEHKTCPGFNVQAWLDNDMQPLSI